MWRSFISRWSSEIAFAAPAAALSIATAEDSLGVSFPQDLRALLLESDGVQGEYGLGLVWNVDRIVKENLACRENAKFKSLYMPFDSLLFFADAGNGDQFAFRVLASKVDGFGVYAWDHENDGRKWVASSLGQYIEWWLTGKLTL